jgi:superfamily II DNA/RNA helicase
MTFSNLGLGPDVLRAVADAGYVEPTPIQRQAIPVILMGRDVLGCAQTGTGKTASFVLPMLEILAAGRAKARMPRSLIIEPTRELAAQVSENFATYGKFHRLSTALLIGGTSFTDQERSLGRGVDALIATPGRLIDLFERGKILLSDVKILVIDEADRMLDMGFIPDVEKIVGLLPRIRQTLFFSATMPPEIRRLADKFLMNPKEISVSPPASPAAMVEHVVIVVPPDHKREALRKLIESEAVKSALIFCNRKKDIGALVRDLTRHNLPAAELHGDMPQSKRTETLDAFKRGEIRLLVCSDVAARGLDISELSHVFNFDVPHNPEDYIHRIGRTGRAGRSGRAFTIAAPEDGKYVTAIGSLIGTPIKRIESAGEPMLALEEDSGTRGRGRGRGRGGSKSHGGASLAHAHAPQKPHVPQTPSAPLASPATPHKPHPIREPHQPQAPAPQRPAPHRPITPHPGGPPQPRATGERPSNDQRESGAKGFSDDLPAFLARPLIIKGDKRD